MDDKYLLTLNGVSKGLGTFSLSDITLNVSYGEKLGIVGENGSGKTTLLNVISGIYKIDSGFLDLKTKNIGVAFDEIPFPKKVTISELSFILKRMIISWQNQKFFDYISDFKLPLTKPIGQFSRGMKMQLNLAVTLSHKAPLVIFDEITSGLDPIVRKTVLRAIDQYISQNNAAVIMTTHNLADVTQICNHLLLLNKGEKILEKDIQNESTEVLEAEFTEAVLKSEVK